MKKKWREKESTTQSQTQLYKFKVEASKTQNKALEIMIYFFTSKTELSKPVTIYQWYHGISQMEK